MAKQQISGIVESIKLSVSGEFPRLTGWANMYPMSVDVVVMQEDGTKAYIKTKVAEKVVHKDFHMGTSYWMTSTQEKASWPWIIKQGFQLLEGNREMFPDAVVAHQPEPILTVWIDDQVVIEGSIEEKVSKTGNTYKIVKRASVVKVMR